jgi:Flp pilus assembly protein TadG
MIRGAAAFSNEPYADNARRDQIAKCPHPRLSRFWRDRRGVSAVEFALIAPVLVIFYCGMAELTQAMMAQRRVSNIASSIGDVVAQNAQLTDARRTTSSPSGPP